jgi:hypothetical protein
MGSKAVMPEPSQKHCEVEKWPSRLAHNQQVNGSNPFFATNHKKGGYGEIVKGIFTSNETPFKRCKN